MAGEEENFGTCQECGATIYPEHLDRQMAEKWEGRLLCPYCLREKRSASGAGMVMPSAPPPVGNTIPLVDVEGSGISSLASQPIGYEKKPTAIRQIGGGPGAMPGVGEVREQHLRRPLLKGSPNATRCRTFHCKLADGPIAYMNEQINEWVDSNDDIEIKFATATIGVVEGKHVDPHLILTVFY